MVILDLLKKKNDIAIKKGSVALKLSFTAVGVYNIELL